VAKIINDCDAMSSSAIVHANARPSVVEVDLPSSSTRMSDVGDAACSPSRASCSTKRLALGTINGIAHDYHRHVLLQVCKKAGALPVSIMFIE
jgi:hypothetical protein